MKTNASKVEMEIWIINKNYSSLEEVPEKQDVILRLTDETDNAVIDKVVSMQDFETGYMIEVLSGSYHLTVTSQEVDYYQIEEDIVVNDDSNIFEYEVVGEEIVHQ